MKLIHAVKARGVILSLTLAALLFTSSCGKEGGFKIPGVDGPHIDLDETRLMISMTFTKFTIGVGSRYEIPKYPNSYVEIGPGVSPTGTFLALNFDLEDLLDGRLQVQEPQSLPGGRAIPGLRSGKLPGVAFSVKRWKNITLYMGNKIFGIFIPHEHGYNGQPVLLPFKKGDKQIGLIGAIGADDKGENAGFLLLLDMNDQVKAQMEYRVEQKYQDDWDF